MCDAQEKERQALTVNKALSSKIKSEKDEVSTTISLCMPISVLTDLSDFEIDVSWMHVSMACSINIPLQFSLILLIFCFDYLLIINQL